MASLRNTSQGIGHEFIRGSNRRSCNAPLVDAPVTVIRPSSGWIPLKFGELWQYRELLYFLIASNLKVRYKQTVLGASWAIIQPVFSMVVFSIFFGRLAGIPSDGKPYPAFAYCALVPWTYFANSLGMASSSLQTYEGVITKVYFPRLIAPLASVLGGLVDFAIAFVVLIAILLAYGIFPSTAVLLLPAFVVLAAASAFAIGLWLAALNVEYRDVRYTVPFLIQVWLFSTPIAYPSSLVPKRWKFVYGLNPMTGVVEGFRWALLGDSHTPWTMISASSIAVAALLAGGLFYFRRMERTFADVV